MFPIVESPSVLSAMLLMTCFPRVSGPAVAVLPHSRLPEGTSSGAKQEGRGETTHQTEVVLRRLGEGTWVVADICLNTIFTFYGLDLGFLLLCSHHANTIYIARI